METILKLTRDLRTAARYLRTNEVRFIVDLYYEIQEYRKATHSQMRAKINGEVQEPTELVHHFASEFAKLERNIKSAMEAYTDNHPVGVWLKKIIGIGPVLAAGLLAHIDIERAPTAGHIWAFAGLDPTKKWVAKQRRPWNASLKTLCWKIGESFVKQSGDPNSVYGKLYHERKAYEAAKNEAGDYADQAAEGEARVRKSTEAHKYYASGVLPPGHLHSRAKRYAVKIFLSHFHAAMYWHHYGTEPPVPFALAHLGHVHLTEPEVPYDELKRVAS